MTTTSLKLTDELKQKAASAAQQLGISTHAFMVDAIRTAADAAEQRAQFVREALDARAELMQTGLAYEANEVRDYLRTRLTDSDVQRPLAKPWQK